MDTTALLLSRIQFAFTISFHIIFPAFSIGLAAWLTILEALHLTTEGLLYVSDYKKGPQRSRWRVLVWKNPPKKFEIEAPASLRHSDICRLEVPSSARVFGLAGSLAVRLSPRFCGHRIKELGACSDRKKSSNLFAVVGMRRLADSRPHDVDARCR